MRKIVVASNNKHKIEEIKSILKDLNIEVLSLNDVGITIEVEETGSTFMENAYIKAREIFNLLREKDYSVLADDSGLSVDALDGAPGVFSARFSGEHGNDSKNNEKLLKLMESVPDDKRSAQFICAMVLINGENDIVKVIGEVEGTILREESGNGGFGYDPLFFTKRYNKTFGELTPEEKNLISHRGNALKKLKEELTNG